MPARDGTRVGTRATLAKKKHVAPPSTCKATTGAAAMSAVNVAEMSLTY